MNKNSYLTALLAKNSLLLVDESLLEEENNIERIPQPGKKIPYVMEPDVTKPWEYCGPGMSKRIHLYGTVLYDHLMKKYRMWYFGRMGPHWRSPECNYQIPGLYVPRTDKKPINYKGNTQDEFGRTFGDNDRGDLTLYAESDDGINWIKPDLGIFTFDGKKNNNIIWDLHGASVFIDENEPDSNKRYKAIGFCRRYRNIFLITSPDGIHWNEKDNLEPVAQRSNEGTFNVSYDNEENLFRAYSIQRFDDRNKRRVICYTESPSLNGPWKESKPIIEPDSWDDEMAYRKYNGLRAEFHNLSAFRYNNIHLGLLGVLYVTAEQIPGEINQMPCDGPIDVQVVYSRDAINWSHADRNRTAVIERGNPNEFDRGMIIGTAKEPIFEGDDIHWYYTGCEHTHGETNMEKRVKRIGRVSWKRDRLVALRAHSEGTITTKQLKLPEKAQNLELNYNSEGGEITVELLNEADKVIDGFSRKECVPLNANQLSGKVSWKNANIGNLDAPVKIKIHLNRAEIYSLKCSDF